MANLNPKTCVYYEVSELLWWSVDRTIKNEITSDVWGGERYKLQGNSTLNYFRSWLSWAFALLWQRLHRTSAQAYANNVCNTEWFHDCDPIRVKTTDPNPSSIRARGSRGRSSQPAGHAKEWSRHGGHDRGGQTILGRRLRWLPVTPVAERNTRPTQVRQHDFLEAKSWPAPPSEIHRITYFKFSLWHRLCFVLVREPAIFFSHALSQSYISRHVGGPEILSRCKFRAQRDMYAFFLTWPQRGITTLQQATQLWC